MLEATTYHLSHASSLFCSGYFEDSVLLFAQANLHYNSLILHFLTLPPHHTQLFPLCVGLANFLPRLAWNCDPPSLSLLGSLG
jgi:hypothetical protein